MDKLAIEYSGMNLGVLALWMLIVLTLAGFAARKIVRGKAVAAGLWGDALFGHAGRVPDRHAAEGVRDLAVGRGSPASISGH
jgi:hypothetical protein